MSPVDLSPVQIPQNPNFLGAVNSKALAKGNSNNDSNSSFQAVLDGQGGSGDGGPAAVRGITRTSKDGATGVSKGTAKVDRSSSEMDARGDSVGAGVEFAGSNGLKQGASSADDNLGNEGVRDSVEVGAGSASSASDLSPKDAALDAAAFAAAAMLAQAQSPAEDIAAFDEGQGSIAASGEVGKSGEVDASALRLFQSAGRLGVALDESILGSSIGSLGSAVVNASVQGPVLGQQGELSGVSGFSLGESELGAAAKLTGSQIGTQVPLAVASGSSTQNGKAGESPANQSKAVPLARQLNNLGSNGVVNAISGLGDLAGAEAVILQSGKEPVAPVGFQPSQLADESVAPLSDSTESPLNWVPNSGSSESGQGKAKPQLGADTSSSDQGGQGGNSGGQKDSQKGALSTPLSTGAKGLVGLGAGVRRSQAMDQAQVTAPRGETLGRSSERLPVRLDVGADLLPADSEKSELPGLSSTDLPATPGHLPTGVSSSLGEAGASQKPVVGSPRLVHSNVEVWKTISDAVERVRSENPSHLAMELRLRDGSAVGIELRMGASGIEASFKSESQSLLKALETQWSAFLDRQPSDLKVASTVFEGRAGLNFSSDGGGDATERREAFEDSAAAASLSSPSKFSEVELPSEEILAPLPAKSSSGLLNLYA